MTEPAGRLWQGEVRCADDNLSLLKSWAESWQPDAGSHLPFGWVSEAVDDKYVLNKSLENQGPKKTQWSCLDSTIIVLMTI